MKSRDKKLKTSLFAVLVFVFFTGQAWGIALSFEPSTSDAIVGDSFDVDLVISGLENFDDLNFFDDDLSGFDFNVNFDDSILAFDSYTLGTGLFTPDGSFGMDMSWGNLGGGSIHLSEIAFGWDFSLQPDSFTLATLSFSAISAGTSTLSFSSSSPWSVMLSDSDWIPNELYADLESGSITVEPVPEPATMLLFATGLAGLAGLHRKTKR